MQPLRMRKDYGEEEIDNISDRISKEIHSVNPYLNIPPTKLVKMIEKEKNERKKQLLKDSLGFWRSTSIPFLGD
jgi:inner membrane protein involved in colicin E2 resistance